MLDFRIKTFLELCRLKNYTKTAHSLHITQPAVTQHIQYLEREYGMNFFDHEARELTLTPKRTDILLVGTDNGGEQPENS